MISLMLAAAMTACGDDGAQSGAVTSQTQQSASDAGSAASYEPKTVMSGDDVTLTLENDSYKAGVKKITAEWENKTDRTIAYGDSFYIEKKQDGKWEKIEFEGTNGAFNLMAYGILSGKSDKKTYDLTRLDELEPGEYRIADKYFFEDDPKPAEVNYCIYEEFTIE